MPDILTSVPDWIKFVLILAVFFACYMGYMVLRYNRVKKQVLELQESLRPGDAVLTQSGLYGVLVSVGKSTAQLRLADGFVIVIDRFSIKQPACDEARRALEHAA